MPLHFYLLLSVALFITLITERFFAKIGEELKISRWRTAVVSWGYLLTVSAVAGLAAAEITNKETREQEKQHVQVEE